MRRFGILAFLSVLATWAAIDALTTLPMDHPAIRYSSDSAHNPVEALRLRFEKREVRLSYDREFGYLPSLLKALQVPLSSQVVVFSKSSFQAPKISPRTPRAIYHSDDIAVGFVKGGDVLEIAAVDPRQGVAFYTLDQEQSVAPAIIQRSECLQCHVGAATLGVPGLVVRSVHTDRNGIVLLRAPAYVSDHDSPLERRWGGWYVTGTHGSQRHLGNQTVEDREHPQLDLEKGANVTDLSRYFDTESYLRPSSDIVSLMILEHQTRMINLITRLGWETRIAVEDAKPGDLTAETRRKLESTAEEVVSYLLFQGEAPLESPVTGSAEYAADFAARGPRDRKGRSLRDLDMRSRMFRYPCSFLIDSPQFDALPGVAKDMVYRRLFQALTADAGAAGGSKWHVADRAAILEILRDTKTDLPGYWKAAR